MRPHCRTEEQRADQREGQDGEESAAAAALLPSALPLFCPPPLLVVFPHVRYVPGTIITRIHDDGGGSTLKRAALQDRAPPTTTQTRTVKKEPRNMEKWIASDGSESVSVY